MASRGRPLTFDPDTALQRALEVFWERGYEGTSISELTRAMGIASASIYAYFGSEESLFRQVMGHYGATAGAPPRNALKEHETAREAIHAMLRATVEYTATVAIPISRHVRMTRSAISPRLATRIFLNSGIGGTPQAA